MKIILFGSTGMLGNYVKKYLSQFHQIVCIDRNIFDIESCDWEKLNGIIQLGELIINCAAAIPQQKCDIRKYITLNTVFPHKLNESAKRCKIQFIHITTDCVFSGKDGNYDENSKHDAEDIYGISKSLGEDKTMCIIRTSIIGEEINNKNSLIEWLIKQKDTTIDGYENVFWNGVTCLQLAKIIEMVINKNDYWQGVRHIFSPRPVSKYELCNYINDIYGLNISITKKQIDYKNLTLSSVCNMNLNIKEIKEQIKEQYNFNISKIGEYKILNTCYFCNHCLSEIFKYDNFPLVGAFMNNNDEIKYEKYYPLTFLYCEQCKIGYVKEIVNENLIFKTINSINHYFYYSSKIPFLNYHFNKLACFINNNYNNKQKILEVGCNDGVLLNKLAVFNRYQLIGIDPSYTIKEITDDKIITINDFFNDNTTKTILHTYGKQDIIVACNCMAHIENISDVYKNMLMLLNDDGIIIIEVHYFKNILDFKQFDFIYHEHMLYYSIRSFYLIACNYNLNMIDVEKIDIHGGSIRIILQKNKESLNQCRISSDKILKYIEEENTMDETVFNIKENIEIWKNELMTIINLHKNKDEFIYGYGASGRVNSILSFLDVTFNYLFEDSSTKVNKITPKYHIPILSSSDIYTLNNVKTIFILAWPYAYDIIKKHRLFIDNGGKFIIVLPIIQFVDKTNINDFLEKYLER
jgi:dTDP-4-dehydrorhamnose reductase/SAM-dependent methyltransferase